MSFLFIFTWRQLGNLDQYGSSSATVPEKNLSFYVSLLRDKIWPVISTFIVFY